ncbi:uncharacterized protein BYT42DRAFT_582269 [Radiomyces spectabilis]|uniref:uncharacterized protein n=1 Tax=Radiomyces spectabilis TaxID=64574 RepID=UPI0022201A76|nr:uncharacterized protein BYT42DRAFT_582269 [Radiomyces spectabilis]KAI8370402.1 hypothetical protein BYT42DRAFT_582269 [Radiomyces spectabilis]
MPSPMWTKKSNNRSAIMSPRQIANKAHTLAYKKLDRDEKRSHPRYTIRERLLLWNTISEAEALLNKRTYRANRRVLAAEDDEPGAVPEPQSIHPYHHYEPEHHSPLRSSETTDMETDEIIEPEKEPSTIVSTTPSTPEEPTLPKPIQPLLSTPSVFVAAKPSSDVNLPFFLLDSASSILPRDCRLIMTHTIAAPHIAAII